MNIQKEELQLAAKILVIDDDPLIIRLLETFLKQAGYKSILSCTDPTIATDLYSQYQPDLVLLDLNMPVMDGFRVMESLNSIEAKVYVPIMILTAETDDRTRLDALEAGAKDYVNKPFSKLEILTRIKNLLEVRFAHKKLQQQNEILEQKVVERTRELRDSQLEIVQRLGLASEYRDNETGQHIIRMSYYSKILAEHYGLPADECELILNASPMHDIGKLGIPDSILLKPGQLTKDEFAIMKTHTDIGARLLEDARSPVVEMARVIALSHHEKWDGTGYPNCLAGKDIPLVGRIVAIADVFDALTSSRPYKAAWPINKAVAEIKRGAGSHFDPELVDCFEKALPEIIEVSQMYQDEPVTKSDPISSIA